MNLLYNLRLTRVLISACHALMLEYRSEIYLWVLTHILPFIMMGLWGPETAQYFLAVFIVRQFTVVWVIFDFEWQVVEGRLSNYLLKPINPVWNFVTAHLAEQLARLPFFIIVILVVLWFFPECRWIPYPSSIPLGIAAIYAAFAMRFAMQYCVAMLTFWFEKAGSLDQVLFLPFFFLSGLVAPLSKFPPLIRRIAEWTPFPYFLSFPARIFTRGLPLDPITNPEILQGFLIIAIYFTLFCLLCSQLWKKGLAQYSGMGA